MIGDATKILIDGDLDIIIDDGSHISLDIVETYLLHWQRLKKGGLYIIEDLRPTYDSFIWPYFPHYPESRFARSHFVDLVDLLMRNVDLREDSEIEFLHYYRELFIIKKKRQ